MSVQYIGVAERPDEFEVDARTRPAHQCGGVAGGLLALGFTERGDIDPAFLAGLPDDVAQRLRETREFNWSGDGFVQVMLTATDVTVEHGSGGDALDDALSEVMNILQEAGLYVWDPQTSQWLW